MWISRATYTVLLTAQVKADLLEKQLQAMQQLWTKEEKRLSGDNEKIALALGTAKERVQKLEALVIKLKDEVEAKKREIGAQLQPITLDESLMEEDGELVDQYRKEFELHGTYDHLLAQEAQTDGGTD